MDSHSPGRRSAWRWLPLSLWCAFGAILVLLHLRAGPWAGFSQPLSAFSIGPDRALYRTAFLLASGASLALATAMRKIHRTGSTLRLALLAAAAIGGAVVALLPSGGQPLATPADRLHALGMALWLSGCVLLVFLQSRARTRAGFPAWWTIRIATALLFTAVVTAKALHAPALGPLQRLLVMLLLGALVPLFSPGTAPR
jgi:hypothetical protein